MLFDRRVRLILYAFVSLAHLPLTFTLLLLCNCEGYPSLNDCTTIAMRRYGLARESMCLPVHVLYWKHAQSNCFQPLH